MKQFNCLVVDDEPIARQIVEAYCSHLPDLKWHTIDQACYTMRFSSRNLIHTRYQLADAFETRPGMPTPLELLDPAKRSIVVAHATDGEGEVVKESQQE